MLTKNKYFIGSKWNNKNNDWGRINYTVKVIIIELYIVKILLIKLKFLYIFLNFRYKWKLINGQSSNTENLNL